MQHIMDYEDKKRIFQQYIEALEEERQKMQVFHRELPLSLHLVSQAIDGYRKQMTSELFLFGRSECEDTSSDGQPVLEEFIPLKRGSSSSEKEEEEEEEEEEITNERSGKKPDWLRSVQLWNQEPDPPSNEESSRKPAAVDEMMVKKKKEVGGAFHPFHGEKNTSKAQAAATSSTAETRRREEKDGRKARRCWSPELHRRFLQALQQLGGPHVATPKQIKELMKVDGLTNDEVKSHLQKYRLHNRRPLSAAVQGCGGGGTTTEPSPQLLVVGGIWVPPPEYAVAAKATDTTTKIYAPVPTLPHLSPPPPQKQKQTHRSPTSPLQWKGGRGTLEEDHANSSSRTTSSSSHTTTTSPPF